ncbi:sulfotransferase family protein [Thiobacillus sp.]
MTNFVQRGYAAIQARNFADAVHWFEKALEETPDDAQTMSWLGQTLCSLGRRAEGARYLRQSGQHLLEGARLSGDINRVLEITQQLQQWGDFPGALELLSQAVLVNGSGFRGFQLLAVTLAQLNKKTEALDAGRQALARAPENIMMQILVASLEADAGLNDDAMRHLETVLSGKPNAREAFRAHKELARVLDNLKVYDQVFPHLQAAAQVSASLPEYSQQNLALLPDLIQANKAGFDRELMGRWSGHAFPQNQPAPIFLIGFFRSGTTLTQEVLGAHPDVFVADETDFVWAMQRELQQMDGSTDSIPDKLRKLDLPGVLRLREFYWNRVKGRFGEGIGQRRLVDKFTLNTIDVGLINCIFPDAKVVFVMRDPRDVCVSCFMQLMVPTPATAHLLNWQGTADFYAQVMNWWIHIRQQMTLDFTEFRYEDAVAQFEPTYRRVFDFLGLTWDPAVVNFHEYAQKKYIASPSRNQVAQPLYSSSVARWRRYGAAFVPVAEKLGPFIRAFDYEPF